MAKDESNAKTERRFYNAKGEESARAKEDTVRAAITVLGEQGGKLEFSKEDFVPGVFNAAAWFGFTTSITNAGGGKHATMSPFERMEDRLAGLSGQDGEWQGDREGGPQTGLILEAAERLGFDKAAIKAKLADGSIKISDLSTAEGVEDMVLTIKAERLEQRRKALKEASKGSGVSLSSLLG